MLLIHGAAAAGCCAAPRVVSNATSQGKHLQLVHVDPCTGEHAVVDCVVGPDGQARDCRRRPLLFRD
jgi:hypothetical protein